MNIPSSQTKIPQGFKFRFSLEEHAGAIIWLAWSPDGGLLASSSADNSVIVWDASKGAIRNKLTGHGDAVVALAWSPDGKSLLSGSYDGTIRKWGKAGTVVRKVDIGDTTPNEVVFSPDGDRVAIGCEDGKVRIWNKSFNGRAKVLTVSTDEIYSVAWSPDGRQLAVSTDGGEIHVFETRSKWGSVAVIDNGSDAVYDVVFSPDGKLLACASQSGDITIRLSGTWKSLAVLKGHTDEVSCVRFSRSGRHVASKSFDGTVRYWDANEGKELARLHEPSQNYWLSGIAFHPTQPVLATLGAGDTIIRVWDLDEGQLKISPRRISERSGASKRQRPAAIHVPDLPEQLVTACADGQCVIYVGAGLSAPAGLPKWSELVQRLLEWAVENQIVRGDMADSLREALGNGDVSQVADMIVSEVNQEKTAKAFNKHLSRLLNYNRPALPPTYSIVKDIPFAAALTTNLDDLLEKTYENRNIPKFTPTDADQLLTDLQNGQFFVLKLFGTIDRPDTLMLSPVEFESKLSSNPWFSKFMENVVVSKTLLFVGASLEGIEGYLKALRFSSEHRTREHYAFVEVSGNAWRVKADILKRRYGINVIPFTPSDEYPEVREFLAKLSDEVRKRLTAAKAGRKSSDSGTIKKVTLRNIGPFGELELNLHENWNVLLGDNGVGKSSIMKAIAVGLVGREARAYAGRLIKAGENAAEIVIEFYEEEGIKYRTQISATGGNNADVDTLPQAPIERTGGILSLGFPALRTMSFDRGAEQIAAVHERPIAQDLLPIVDGRPDPRLDSLRDWLIRLDHVIKSETKPSERRRYINLRDRFFKIIEGLTPGLEMKVEVDVKLKQVYVRTQDGKIPIESVSQGTVSLLGWIGVFLQRYFAISKHAAPTSEERAIVLIDEIDAHMHPRWQQIIIPRLKDLLPNVQFIATTHSPLIVSGMPPNQLFRFARGSAGRVVQLEVLPEMSSGRADQILTNDLFGLESSKDLETQGLLEKYNRLSMKKRLTAADKQQLTTLARKLQRRVPSPEERKEARIASEMISDFYREKIRELPEERKKEMLREVESKLLEIS